MQLFNYGYHIKAPNSQSTPRSLQHYHYDFKGEQIMIRIDD